MDPKTRKLWILVFLCLVRGQDFADSADEHLGKTTKAINNCCAILSKGCHNLRLVLITQYVQKCRTHTAYVVIFVKKCEYVLIFATKVLVWGISASNFIISQVCVAHTCSI